jgi:hypothetical protein
MGQSFNKPMHTDEKMIQTDKEEGCKPIWTDGNPYASDDFIRLHPFQAKLTH